jgi:hypothetical protein
MGIALIFVGCDNQGCDMLTPLADPFPQEALLDEAIMVHLSDDGMTQLETITPTLLGSLAGFDCATAPCPAEDGTCDADNVCRSLYEDKGLIGQKIGQQDVSGITICEEACESDDLPCLEAFFDKCNIYVQLDAVQFSGNTTGGLQFDVSATLFSSPLPIKYELPLLGERNCEASINRAEKSIVTTLSFDDTNPLNRMRVIMSEPSISIDVNDDLDHDCGALANVALGLFGGVLENQIQDELNSALDEALNGILFESCNAENPCPFSDITFCDIDMSVCRFAGVIASETNEAMKVPREMGMEGQIALDQFLSQFMKPGVGVDLAAHARDVVVPSGNDGTLAHAMNVKVKGGFRVPLQLQEQPSCVPSIEAVEPLDLTFEAPLLTASGVPYDFLMAVSANYLAQFSESLRQSGALCQTLDASVLAGLSSGAIALLLPSLNRLTQNESVPLQIDVVPQGRVTLEIGRNLTTEDPNEPGRFTLEEPLMGLNIQDLDLDMFAKLPGGWVRFLTVRTDLYIDLSMAVTETGGINLLVGDATNWIQDIDVLNSGMLSESPADLEESLPSLVSVFLPGLLDSMELDFELPSVSGFEFSIAEIAGVGEIGETLLGDTKYGHMGIYADMSFDPAGLEDGAFGQMADLSVDTWAAVKAIDFPTASEWRTGAHVKVNLSVAVMNEGFENEPLTTWIKIDEGPYHPLFQGRELTVIDPLLDRPGYHQIHIQTSLTGHPHTRDPEGTSLRIYTEILPDPLAEIDTHIALENVPGIQSVIASAGGQEHGKVPVQTSGFSCESVPLMNASFWGLILGLCCMRRRRKHVN